MYYLYLWNTGKSKGVILSHGGILNNCEGAIEILEPLIQRDQTRFLTWLPLSTHMNILFSLYKLLCQQVFYAESIEKLIKNMNECSPEVMTAVQDFIKTFIKK